LQLRNDALFKQHLHVTDELRRHLEENAVGEGGVAVVADDVEPVQSSPPADSPCASSCVTSRSLDAYMTPLRFMQQLFICLNRRNLSAGTTPVNPASPMQLAALKTYQPEATAGAGVQAAAAKILGGQLA